MILGRKLFWASAHVDIALNSLRRLRKVQGGSLMEGASSEKKSRSKVSSSAKLLSYAESLMKRASTKNFFKEIIILL